MKWAGGKRWLVPYLLVSGILIALGAWLSLYAEGLAVSLGLVPDRALISDINPHTINFYSWLKRGLRISLRMRNEETYFYARRARFNQLIREGKADSKESASLFYYLNRTCYNGLCRFNSKGEFNVPFGRYNKINYKTDFSEYALGIRELGLQCADFEQLPLEGDDFVYADPPYDVEFTHYSKEDFRWDDK